MPRPKIIIPQEALERLYWKEHKSKAKIARIYKCSEVIIRAEMRELGIPTRSTSDARMRYRKFDFSGNLVEKAYLIGFRLGDLNVYKRTQTSEFIVVRCNTTQIVQVKLMENLFSKYGRVGVSPGKYSTNVNCYLNLSFEFLLPSDKRVPSWVEEDVQYGAAFIAGYIDAEGNFLLNQKRARFKVDSYDKEILMWIAEWLQKQSISVKIRCIALKNKLRKGGTRFNNDLWRVNVNEAFSLLRFIQLIKPFIKHKTRLHHIKICEDNIHSRIRNRTIKYATI